MLIAFSISISFCREWRWVAWVSDLYLVLIIRIARVE
jgi:hypothetical protein